MAYSNYAYAIYQAIKVDINTEISRCEIENRDKFPAFDEVSELIGKHGKGIVIRCLSDNLASAGSNEYEDRIYTFNLMAYVRDTRKDQKEIMDFAEHIKYALQNNKTVIEGSTYHREVNIEYLEPEEENELIKRALLKLEVIKDG